MKKQFYLLLGVIFLLFSLKMSAQIIKGTYAIKNVQTGMLLRIKDANNKNATPLVAYEPVNWKCMTWDFKHVEGDTYQLKNLFTGKTFQAAELINGGVLEQQPLVTAQLNQQYDFVLLQNNIYFIKQKGTDLYLTPEDKKGVVNTGIKLYKKDGSKLQQWIIYEQKPTM